MLLHQVRMDRDDANAETIRAALRCGHRALIDVAAVAVSTALAQDRHRWIFHAAVFNFAVIGFDPHMFRIDPAEMNARAQLQ